jgi:cytidylate kinase
MNYHDFSFSLAQSLLRSQAQPGHPEPAPATQAAQAHPFTISISREVGALGTAVGRAVGARLGWPVYDQEIIDKVGAEMRKPTFQLQAIDERPAGLFEKFLATLLGEYHVSPDTYLKYLIATIRALGVVGHCVIVGRGSFCILPPTSTLRVRLVGDRADRVRTIARQRGLTEREAVAWVDATENERILFVKRYFKTDPADPHLYDLVLNVSRLSLDECADTIADLVRRLEGRPGHQATPAAAAAR